MLGIIVICYFSHIEVVSSAILAHSASAWFIGIVDIHVISHTSRLFAGAIVGGDGVGNNITAQSVIDQLRALGKNKRIAAVVLRVDSPGGDALASDLMCMFLTIFVYVSYHF